MAAWGMVYDIVYALMARDGRDKVLFGNSAPLSHIAFERSCAGSAFPELWFELPLMGDPWFDLHALTSQEALEPGMKLEPDVTGGHPELFEWFAGAQGVRQLALSYDVGRGDVDNPAVQLLVYDTAAHVPFLELAGGAGAVESFRAFEDRLPDGWFPCYTGVLPGRADFGVRVECIPTDEQKRAYAEDPALIERHLRQAGVQRIGDTVLPRCQAFAQTPFQIEFQFDVLPGGYLGDTFAISARFNTPDADDGWETFDPHGAAGELMEQVESWGLADERWRLMADTSFCKSIERAGKTLLAASHPAFVKLRWRGGDPLDAKAYLLVRFEG